MDGFEIILIATGLLAIGFFRVQNWRMRRADKNNNPGFGYQLLIVLIIFILVGNFCFAVFCALGVMAYSREQVTLLSLLCVVVAAVAGVATFRFVKARFILKCGAIWAGTMGLAFFDTPARPLIAPYSSVWSPCCQASSSWGDGGGGKQRDCGS